MATSILKKYLEVCIEKYPAISTIHAKHLLSLIEKRDMLAIEYLRSHSDDSVLQAYCDEEVLECITTDYYSSYTTDESCIQILTMLQSESKCDKVKSALQKCIEFIALPNGTEIDAKDLPLQALGSSLKTLFKEHPEHVGLVRSCIEHMKNSLGV